MVTFARMGMRYYGKDGKFGLRGGSQGVAFWGRIEETFGIFMDFAQYVVDKGT